MVMWCKSYRGLLIHLLLPSAIDFIAKENDQSPCYCLPAIAMGKAVGTLGIKSQATIVGLSDGRKKTLINAGHPFFFSVLAGSQLICHALLGW